MLRIARAPGVLLAGATLLLAACDAPTDPQPASPSGSFRSTPQQASEGRNPDQHALARAVPAFGGLFLESGQPVVYLTDPSSRGAIEGALAEFFAARGLTASDLQVRPARFTYHELEGFFERARPTVFAGPGGVFADLDEADNQVTLGVVDAAAETRVRAAVAALGLPDGAVGVEITSPIIPVKTLRDRFDPIPGGVQIHFGNYLCSIGIIAEVGGQPYFVTASHCTKRAGGVEGTTYYQPLSSVDGTVIGTEAVDPAYNAECPYAGGKCRYSDAALIASTGARAFALGSIAATSGGIEWSNGYYTVAGAATGDAVMGDARSKVGRTTGFTSGTVSATCVDTGVLGSPNVLLCQDFVEGNGTIVGSGDSGSPVFEGNSSVTWWGILWGGSSDGSTFIYSPASNVQQELGTLKVTSSGGGGGTTPPETLNASFSYRCHFAACDFDASSSTGATSYDWNFGDDDTGSGEMVSHEYTGTDNYTVTLTVADATGTDAATATITCATKGPNLQCK